MEVKVTWCLSRESFVSLWTLPPACPPSDGTRVPPTVQGAGKEYSTRGCPHTAHGSQGVHPTPPLWSGHGTSVTLASRSMVAPRLCILHTHAPVAASGAQSLGAAVSPLGSLPCPCCPPQETPSLPPEEGESSE